MDWNSLQNVLTGNVSIIGIPVAKLALAALAITLSLILSNLFANVILKSIEKFTTVSKTNLDDELIRIIRKPISWLIVLGGLWLAEAILSEHLSPDVSALIDKALTILTMLLVAYIFFTTSTLLGQALSQLTLRTNTEFDDLFVPYLPKFIQIIVIVIVVIKGSEILLGASAGALIGLIGGAGLTFGLLLKDIVYDWFCTLVIYVDNLYKAGDTLVVDGIDGLVQVVDVGLRSTKLRLLKYNAIKKIPNSKMIGGNLANWSQSNTDDLSYGITVILKIEKVTNKKMARLCRLLKEVPKPIDCLYKLCFVWFDPLLTEDSYRTINMQVFDNDPNSDTGAINPLKDAIMALLKEEEVDLIDIIISHDEGELRIIEPQGVQEYEEDQLAKDTELKVATISEAAEQRAIDGVI